VDLRVPLLKRILALPGQVSAESLDGRYFGPLPAASLVGCAAPHLTFEEQ
jgi:type IV secretory pathway protease TraF